MPWITHPHELTMPRYDHTAVPINDHTFIVLGGYDNDSVELVDINNKGNSSFESTNFNFPNLPTQRRDHTSVIHNNFVYCIGGYDGSSSLNTVIRLNIGNPTPKWETLPNMKEENYAFAATIHNDNIYVFGGRNDNGKVSTAEQYNITTNTWSVIENQMITPRVYHSVVTVGNLIYIIGGISDWDPLDSVEVFDPVAKTFQSASSLPMPLWYTRAVVVANRYIVVTGGQTANELFLSSCCLFDTQESSNRGWKLISNMKMNIEREMHAALVLNNDTIVVCGGWSKRVEIGTIEYIPFQSLIAPMNEMQDIVDKWSLAKKQYLKSQKELKTVEKTIRNLSEDDQFMVQHLIEGQSSITDEYNHNNIVNSVKFDDLLDKVLLRNQMDKEAAERKSKELFAPHPMLSAQVTIKEKEDHINNLQQIKNEKELANLKAEGKFGKI